jgi:hypothetical protein
MSIIALPRPASEALPPALTVVVHDQLVERELAPLVRFDGGALVRYVLQSDAEADGTDADLWVCPQQPSDPTRRVLFETAMGTLIEQDDRGRIIANGVMQFDEPLVAFGSAVLGRPGPLAIGASAALVVGRREDAIRRARIGITGPILWVFDQPEVSDCAADLEPWLRLARCLHARRTSLQRTL